MEEIDIFNSFNIKIGSSTKDEAHKKGLWHRTVNFLLVDTDKKMIIFQEKDSGNVSDKIKKGEFFVKLNGGHLQKREDLNQGMRELYEELGIKVKFEEIIPVGINQTSADLSDDFKIREFMYFYIVPVKSSEDKIRFIDGEVKSVIYVDINKGLEVLQEKRESVEGVVFDGKKKVEVLLNASNFRNFTDDNLYTRIFLAVNRYLSQESQENILI